MHHVRSLVVAAAFAAIWVLAPGAPAQSVLQVVHDPELAQVSLSLGAAGDVDGDGLADLVVGGYAYDGAAGYQCGMARVYSAASGALLHALEGRWELDWYGMAVDGVGDVDGDGYGDFVVGASQGSPIDTPPGWALVHSGSDGSVLHEFVGLQSGDQLGWAVAGAGDVDADGRPDVVVGAPFGHGAVGEYVRVYSGLDGAVLHTFHSSGYEWFGYDVDGAGDVNADGHADVVVGSWHGRGDENEGTVRVYSGLDGELLHVFDGDHPDDYLGCAVAGAGDVNGDGYADFMAGAYRHNAPLPPAYVRVWSGVDGELLHELTGSTPNDHFGSALDGVGDVDGDGLDDFVVLGSAPLHGIQVFSGGEGSALYRLPPALGQEPRWLAVGLGNAGGDRTPDLAALGVDHDVLVYSGGCLAPAAHCAAAPNSAGPGATLCTEGSVSVTADDLLLLVTGAVPEQFGVFYYGPEAIEEPFGDGFRCVGPGALGVFRLDPPVQVDPAGLASRPLDLTRPPAGSGPGAIEAGSLWHFQFWYRDPELPDGSGFNLSDALRVAFCP